MQSIRVSTWTELLDVLYADSWKQELGRFRSDFAFRGLEAPEEELSTGLARLGEQGAALESHLLRNFRKYALRDAVPHDSLWNWLALAEHYGLPTRLLDWTFSPLVALHFATECVERFADDAIVWCVNFVEVKQFMPAPLRKLLEDEGANVFTAEMLGRAADNLKDFEKLERAPFVTFFEPPSLDQRIVNQFALFSFMSSAAADLLDWLKEHPAVCRRVIVPAGLKWEVRDKLDQANVTERVLYPGLDGLSRWLRRQYMPARGGQAAPQR